MCVCACVCVCPSAVCYLATRGCHSVCVCVCEVGQAVFACGRATHCAQERKAKLHTTHSGQYLPLPCYLSVMQLRGSAVEPLSQCQVPAQQNKAPLSYPCSVLGAAEQWTHPPQCNVLDALGVQGWLALLCGAENIVGQPDTEEGVGTRGETCVVAPSIYQHRTPQAREEVKSP